MHHAVEYLLDFENQSNVCTEWFGRNPFNVIREIFREVVDDSDDSLVGLFFSIDREALEIRIADVYYVCDLFGYGWKSGIGVSL